MGNPRSAADEVDACHLQFVDRDRLAGGRHPWYREVLNLSRGFPDVDAQPESWRAIPVFDPMVEQVTCPVVSRHRGQEAFLLTQTAY